jgi:hypothetical protein
MASDMSGFAAPTPFADSRTTVNGVTVAASTPVGAAQNIDVAIVPKGTGALVATVPDQTDVGGNTRGANAVDLQTLRTSFDQIAASTGSVIAGGSANRVLAAASYGAIGGGFSNSISATGSVVGGGNGNTTGSSVSYGTISGGAGNTIGGSTSYSGIGGGQSNAISSNATHAVISGGQSNICSSTADHAAVGGGQANNITAAFGAIGGGYSNTVAGDYSCAPGGRLTSARLMGQMAFAAGNFNAAGDAQWNLCVWRVQTTNATPTALTSDGAALSSLNGLGLALNFDHMYLVKGQVTARVPGTSGATSAWDIACLVRRDATVNTIMGSTVTLLWQDAAAAAWSVALSLNATFGDLSIVATGAAATTIRWVAAFTAIEQNG